MNDKFVVPAHIMTRELDGEVVLLDMTSGTYFGLDQVGARIWLLIGQGNTLADICEKIYQEYAVTKSELELDVTSLVAELKERGLIIPC